MINSTNTIHIDGSTIDPADIVGTFKSEKGDRFTRFVVRPLALLTALGMGVAVFMASAFMILLSLAMLPLLAVSMWAVKSKIEKDMAASSETPNEAPIGSTE